MESLSVVLNRHSEEAAWNCNANGLCQSEVGGSVNGP